MDKLTWADQRKISAVGRELYCLSSIETISRTSCEDLMSYA